MSLAIHVICSVRFTTSRSSFIQACVANLFITIPSLSNSLEKLKLSIQSAQIALAALAFLQVYIMKFLYCTIYKFLDKRIHEFLLRNVFGNSIIAL